MNIFQEYPETRQQFEFEFEFQSLGDRMTATALRSVQLLSSDPPLKRANSWVGGKASQRVSL